MTKICYREKSQ